MKHPALPSLITIRSVSNVQEKDLLSEHSSIIPVSYTHLIGGGAGEGLNPLDIVKFTSAYATLIRKTCKAKSNKIVVGRDARISGEMVKNVVVGTLMGMGWDVVDIDLASTPTTELAVTMEGTCGCLLYTSNGGSNEWCHARSIDRGVPDS